MLSSRRRIEALLAGGGPVLAQPVHVNELVPQVRGSCGGSRSPLVGKHVSGTSRSTAPRGVALDNGTPIDLSITEYRLLRYLLVNRGQTVTRSQILQSIWGTDRCSPKLVDVYVGYLRRKLPDSVNIRSVRSLGYVLEPSPQ